MLSYLITPYDTLPFMFYKKNKLTDNFTFSFQSPYKVITSYNSLPPLVTAYHILSPMYDGKIISETTLNLVSSLLKKLSPIATSYHVLSHLITLYPHV